MINFQNHWSVCYLHFIDRENVTIEHDGDGSNHIIQRVTECRQHHATLLGSLSGARDAGVQTRGGSIR